MGFAQLAPARRARGQRYSTAQGARSPRHARWITGSIRNYGEIHNTWYICKSCHAKKTSAARRGDAKVLQFFLAKFNNYQAELTPFVEQEQERARKQLTLIK